MSQTPIPLDSIPKSGLASGRMEFKLDGTFEGKLSMSGTQQEMNLSGTYQVDKDVVTIHNSLNNSTTKSKVVLWEDYLALEPATPEEFSYTFYYKRIK